MSSIKVLLRDKKRRPDGTAPIIIRITKERVTREIFLGFYVTPKEWDYKFHRVKKAHPNADTINIAILKKLSESSKLLYDAESDTENVSLVAIKGKIKNKNYSSFFAVAQDYFSDLEKLKKYNQLTGEKPRSKIFREFLDGGDIRLQEITVPLLKKFMIYLKADKKLKDYSIMNYMVFIRSIFNRGIQNGLVEQKYYPFGKGKIQIRYPETMKIGLSADEIKLLEKAEFEKDSQQWNAKNIWLCSFYLAGIRVSDIVQLKWEAFSDGRFHYVMGKNKKIVTLPVTEKVKEILSLYKDEKKSRKFVFPYVNETHEGDDKKFHSRVRYGNKMISDALVDVAKVAGIKKRITMHLSRHSFGQLAGNKISPQVLQKLYRHTDLKTTIGYQGNFIHEEMDEALNKVLDF